MSTKRINDVVASLEYQRKSLCLAKRTTQVLLSREGKELSDKTSKNYNNAIDAMGKMVISVWNEIDYKVPFVEYSENEPLSRQSYVFRKGYDANSEMAVINGMNSKTVAVLEEMEYLTHVLNHSDNSKFELDKDFFKNIKIAKSAIDSIIKEINTFFLVDESITDDITEESTITKPKTHSRSNQPTSSQAREEAKKRSRRNKKTK